MPLTAPILQGTRLRLRALVEADRADLFAIFSDPEVMRYWSGPPWTSPQQADRLYEADAAGLRDGDALRFGIELGGHVVGCVSVFRISESSRRAELGYLLHRAVWGLGIATEACTLALDHAFGAMNLHRMEADTDPRNHASVRLLTGLGFRQEGVLRERWIVGDEISDSAWFGLLAREWRARRVTGG